MTYWDGLLILVFIGIIPASSAWFLRDKKTYFSNLNSGKRRESYLTTILSQWLLCAALIVLWIADGRSWESLGLHLQTGPGFWVSAGIAAAFLYYFYFQLKQLSTGEPELIQKSRDQMGDIVYLMPHNRQELHHFYGVSITAGIVEELLFRGYLIWLFIQFMPLWAAAIVAILLFGLAHSYQGLKHLPEIIFYGAILMGVFILSGSLWIPIVLHILGDVLQGRIAYTVITRTEPAREVQ